MRKAAIFAGSFCAAVFLVQYGWPVALLFGLTGLCLLTGRTRIPTPKRNRLHIILICAGCLAGFLWCMAYHALFMAPAEALDEQTVPISAVVLDYPAKTDYGVSVLTRIRVEPDREIKAVLYADEAYSMLKPGDGLTGRARLSLATRVNGEAVTYYAAKGIFLRVYPEGALTLQAVERVPARYFPAVLAHGLSQSVNTLFDEESAPFMKAMLLGNREDLSDSIQSALSRSGLSHIMSLSGMHVTMLVGMLALLLRRRRTKVLVCLPMIVVFMLMAGNTPAVMRAGIMQMLFLIAPLLNRETDPPTSLSLALLLIFIQNPYSATDIGLQLSFGAMAGILLFAGKLYEVLSWKLNLGRKAVGRFVLTTTATTLGALVFVLPLAALYFGLVSLIAPLSNLLVLWGMPYVFAGGLLAAIIGVLIVPAGQILAFVVGLLAKYMIQVTVLLGSLPWVAVPLSNPYVIFWLIFSYLLLWLYLLWRKDRGRILIPVCFCAVALLLSVLMANLSVSRKTTFTVLDVGQGQSIALFSGGSAGLIDCGGNRYPSAGQVAADYFEGAGYQKLEILILTHYHSDHINGVEDLFDRMEIRRLMLPDIEPDSVPRARLVGLAEKYGAQILWIDEDTGFRFGSLAVRVYAPLFKTKDNEASLSLLCSDGEFDMLVTADIDAHAEKMLVKYGDLPDIEVMIAGHHGSKYSASELLLETVTPEIAVISVGNNRYGQPAPETLSRLEAAGVTVYRTDLQGNVVVQHGAR